MLKSKTMGHGTIKKLRTGAVVAVLATSTIFGVSNEVVSADEVTTNTESVATEAQPATEQQISEAKTEADTANTAVTEQQSKVATAEQNVASAESTVAGIQEQIKNVDTVSAEKVEEAKAEATEKANALATAEENVKSAQTSQATTEQKVAEQTTAKNNADATATKAASAVADAEKKVADLSTKTDTAQLQKNVEDLTEKVSKDEQSVTNAKQALENAKTSEANKTKAVEDAKISVDKAQAKADKANSSLTTAKAKESETVKNLETAKKALEDAKKGVEKTVQTGTKTTSEGGKTTLKEGVATSDFFQSNGVVTSDAYLKAIKALAEGKGLHSAVRKAIADGLEDYPGSSLADIAAPDLTSFRSWKENYDPQFSNTDKTTKVSVHDLTDEQLTDLALFYTALVNDLRSKVGTEPLKVTTESVAVTKDAIRKLFNDSFPEYKDMNEQQLRANGFWGPESIKGVTNSGTIVEYLEKAQGRGKLLSTPLANQIQYANNNGAFQTMADLKANILGFVGKMLYTPTGTGSVVNTAGRHETLFNSALSILGLNNKYNSVGLEFDFYTVFNGLGYTAPGTYALMLNTDGKAIENPYQTTTGGKTTTTPIFETKTVVDEQAVANAQKAYDDAVKADESAKAELDSAQSAYDTANQALEASKKSLSDLTNGTVDIPALEKAIVDAQAQLDADKVSLQSAKETLAVAKASAVDKTNALARAQAELIKAKSANKKAQAEVVKANEELEVLTKANEVAKLALANAVAERDKAKTSSDEAKSKADALEKALVNAPLVLKELNTKLEEAQSKAAVVRAELETAQQVLEGLKATAKEKTDYYNKLVALKSEQDKANAEVAKANELKAKADTIAKSGGVPTNVYNANGELVDVVDSKVEVTTNKVAVPVSYGTTAKIETAKVVTGNTLPETGDAGSVLGLMGVVVGALGLAGFKKKED